MNPRKRSLDNDKLFEDSISEDSKLAKIKQQGCYKLSMLTALNAPHIKAGPWVSICLATFKETSVHYPKITENVNDFLQSLKRTSKGNNIHNVLRLFLNYLSHLFPLLILPHMTLASLKLSAPPSKLSPNLLVLLLLLPFLPCMAQFLIT